MMSPMESGYRISTGVELAGIDAPPDYRRIGAQSARRRIC